MYKNYLKHNGNTYYRGTYKTPTTATRFGTLDLKRFVEKLKALKKENVNSYISITFNGQEIAQIKQYQ